LADTGYSTQSFFFDYDRDGDLDMLLLHHNPRNLAVLNPNATALLFKQPDAAIGLKLYRNDNNRFTDVTATSNLNNSTLSYGLEQGLLTSIMMAGQICTFPTIMAFRIFYTSIIKTEHSRMNLKNA
jgi:hypothetical protein